MGRLILRRRIIAVISIAVTPALEGVQQTEPVSDFVGEGARGGAAADFEGDEAAVEVEEVFGDGVAGAVGEGAYA